MRSKAPALHALLQGTAPPEPSAADADAAAAKRTAPIASHPSGAGGVPVAHAVPAPYGLPVDPRPLPAASVPLDGPRHGGSGGAPPPPASTPLPPRRTDFPLRPPPSGARKSGSQPGASEGAEASLKPPTSAADANAQLSETQARLDSVTNELSVKAMLLRTPKARMAVMGLSEADMDAAREQKATLEAEAGALRAQLDELEAALRQLSAAD